MGVTKLQISYSRPNATYNAGSMVDGQVNIELDEAIKIKSIKLKVKGKAKVQFTCTESNSRNETRTVTYRNSETYFDQDLMILVLPKGKSSTELGKGTHNFPFKFQLPSMIPSSYKDTVGQVMYFSKCIIERPWNLNLKTKQPFTVITPLDFNELDCQRPVNVSNQKQLCCLCCASGPISASLHLDRKGYVPGEAIAVKAEIINDSNRQISKSYVELKRATSYHAPYKSEFSLKIVARIERPGFSADDDDVWNGEQLVIPPGPPSFLKYCTIIDIRYILELHVVPAGPALDLLVPVDVIIGATPLPSLPQQQQPEAASAPKASASKRASPAKTTKLSPVEI